MAVLLHWSVASYVRVIIELLGHIPGTTTSPNQRIVIDPQPGLVAVTELTSAGGRGLSQLIVMFGGQITLRLRAPIILQSGETSIVRARDRRGEVQNRIRAKLCTTKFVIVFISSTVYSGE